MSRYLREDKLASDIARKLRNVSDGDLAWIAWLSPPNMALVCERFETTADVLRRAQVYETARRRAFPERQTNVPIAFGLGGETVAKSILARHCHQPRLLTDRA